MPIKYSVTFELDSKDYAPGTDMFELGKAICAGTADWPEEITIAVGDRKETFNPCNRE